MRHSRRLQSFWSLQNKAHRQNSSQTSSAASAVFAAFIRLSRRIGFEVANLPIEPVSIAGTMQSALYGPTLYGSKFQLAAEPSQLIEGVVKDADTGEPIPGIKVTSWMLAGTKLRGIDLVESVSDDQGRYRLDGLPRGEGNGNRSRLRDGSDRSAWRLRAECVQFQKIHRAPEAAPPAGTKKKRVKEKKGKGLLAPLSPQQHQRTTNDP